MMTQVAEKSIEEKIGQLIIVGFHGTSVDEPSVQKALAQAKNGEIGGIGIYGYNIQDRPQLENLLKAFREVDAELPLFIFLDQEGGKVQRLKSTNGFQDTKSARNVAETMSRDEAFLHYQGLATMLSEAGFNFNCAPCVDLDLKNEQGASACPVIGGIERAYSTSVDSVVKYAETMIDAQSEQGILSCLKHFPGHGSACGDTHEDIVDITKSWDEIELEPYRQLIEKQKVDLIMSAHLFHQEIDSKFPCTLSSKWLGKLRNDLNYKGLIVSDCMHMRAMLKHYTLKEVVIHGLNAGLDIFYYSNNPLAAKEQGVRQASDAQSDYIQVNDWIVPDADLPRKIKDAIMSAIEEGSINIDTINTAYNRVRDTKARLI